MSALSDAVAAFLAKYPPEAELEWKGKGRPRIGTESDPNAKVAWAATLTAASERHQRNDGGVV